MSWKYNLESKIDLTLGLKEDDYFDQKLIKRGREQQETAGIILDKLQDYPGIILGDEVGMGKTWIALLVALSVAKKKPVLILTPGKVLTNQWRKQFWDMLEKKIVDEDLREDFKDYIEVEEDFNELLRLAKSNRYGIYICSMNSVKTWPPYRRLKDEKGIFGLTIIDEGHNFKNESTRRYQIFENTREDAKISSPLKSQSERILILTATPFQLGHYELRGVLNIFNSTSCSKKLKEKFSEDLDNTLRNLEKYQKKMSQFDSRFKRLSLEEYKIFCNRLKSGDVEEGDSYKITAPMKYYNELRLIKKELNSNLLKFLIRNVKNKKHRDSSANPMEIPQDQQLLFFLTEQLTKIKRKHFPDSSGHQAALSSSYARFDDHIKKMETFNQLQINHYRELSKSLYKDYYAHSDHPKMSTIVNMAFEEWKQGKKTLIFCFFIKTLKEFSKKLEHKVESYISNEKKKLEKKYSGLDVFRRNVGISNNRSSLVFRDNLFNVSLVPLLDELKINHDEVTSVDEAEIDRIVDFLLKVNFNPSSVNFSKLLSAFVFHTFSKFNENHEEKIPVKLIDDFEFILNPKKMAKIYKGQDRKLQEGQQGVREDEIRQYVENFINSESRYEKLLYHPCIWEKHSEKLEEIDVNVRVQITEIISAYFTSDEFLYLELFNGLNKMPELEDIPKIYQAKSFNDKESTYTKINRFLDHASSIAPQNLEFLAREMNYRYQKNKTDSAKIIVETVDGSDSSDEKIRTVTAFRTPLPPYILVSTSVLSEGVDLHTECNRIVHYDHEWNPASLEQKNGRLDRVGSKSEREGEPLFIHYPYLKHTQDEKAYRIVMARKSWFEAVMGEEYKTKWDLDEMDKESIFALPDEIKKELTMSLDNDAHKKSG